MHMSVKADCSLKEIYF